ncbi:helicase associated domain-containing protein [Streptomyces sp. NPDC059460]|uniref:helicase associated domain-containing protein n=1 Tax=Streptomyces sp. NPDC059460 TaxID=3346840 RepID=UPI00368FBB95
MRTLARTAGNGLGVPEPGTATPSRQGGCETGCTTPEDRSANQREDRGAAKGSDAFTRGVAALTQYIAREGKTVVGRGHVEHLPDGTTVRLGVFLSNQKSRRDRLSEQQLATLAALGLEWAA